MLSGHLPKPGCFCRLEAPFLGANGAFKKITGWGGIPRTPARLTSPSVSGEFRHAELVESLVGRSDLWFPASAAMVLVRLDISLFLKPAILALKRAQ